MTALQVIDEIKILAPKEREQVIGFLSSLKEEKPSFQYADDTTVMELSEEILRHHAPLMMKLAS